MALELTPAEAKQWELDGYFVREDVFTAAEVAEFGRAAERAVAVVAELAAGGNTYHLDGNRFVDIDHLTVQYEHQAGTDRVRVIEPVHELDAQFSKLIGDSRLVEPMRQLVGSERVGLWTAKLNLKQALEGSGFRWHQDSPYWIHASEDVDRLPNVFVAFDDAAAANGCLRLVRGSHTRGCLPGLADGSQLEGFFTHLDEIDAANIVAPSLRAGSLLFFSPHIIHGSLPNSSARARRAIIATYQPAGLVELKSGRPSVFY